MSLSGNSGWVDLDGIDNVRDLGGLATARGTTRRGVLYRSSTPQEATLDAQRILLEDLGIRRLIDLRTPREVETEGVGALRAGDVSYHNFPLAGRAHLLQDLVPATANPNLADFYVELLEQGGSAVVSTARLLASGTCPTLVFCAAGKDRTGVLVATILDAVGVLKSEIADDYARTGERMARIRARLVSLASYRHVGPIDDPLLSANANTMAEFLDRLHSGYGGGRSWLLSKGVTHREIDEVQAALVSPTGA